MKKVQIIDMINLFFVVGISIMVGSIVLIVTGILDVYWLSFGFGLGFGVVILGSVLIPFSVLAYSRYIFGKKKVYGLYNPITKVIEYHIGGMVMTQFQFAKSMSLMKKHAVDLNKDIVFCTNLLSLEKIENMEKCFGAKIEVYSVGLLEKASFYIPYFITRVWMKKFERHAVIKGIVRFEQ